MTGMRSIQWRSPRERGDLLKAVAASLAVHGTAALLWLLVASGLLVFSDAYLRQLQAAQEKARKDADAQIPTVFVDLSPDLASPEPPRDTPFYATVDSLAANPEPPKKETTQPKADGTQEEAPRVVEVLRPAPEPQQPSAPSEPDREPPPRDLTLGSEEPPPRPRPRTLTEARARAGITVGPKLRQDGGVGRIGNLSFDAKRTPYSDYDARVIAAIQQRWYDLLEDNVLPRRPGRVVVELTMHYDGRVTAVTVKQQEVGEVLTLYCTKAITDPAPYERWPDSMRQFVGRDYREVRFTFYYQ